VGIEVDEEYFEIAVKAIPRLARIPSQVNFLELTSSESK